MKTLALTGSIGMGKSTVMSFFEAEGVPVWSADEVVKTLYEPSSAAVHPLSKLVPEALENGGMSKAKLRDAIRAEPSLLQKIEAIVHPLVKDSREAFLNAHKNAPLVLFEIPLLFETGGDADFDKVIVVSAPADVQKARVLARNTMSEADFYLILSKQVPDKDKRARADYIIDTGTSLEDTQTAVRRLIAELKQD